jgi:RNA polymerase sigma-70 factor (TIGR02954 family)
VDYEYLALAAVKGNEAAFNQLMQEHKIQLYKIAFSYLKNEADALEAIQEVTCRAYVRIGKLKEPRHFSTWLIRILMNYCIDELKKRAKRHAHASLLSVEPVSVSGSDEHDHLQRLVLDSVVAQLEEKYQTVIQLKYYHDLTIPEIARTLERPEGTIKTWLGKALAGLRQRLEKDGDSRA